MAGILRRKAVLWASLGIVALVGAFSYSGFLMASSFTMSNPQAIEHWRSVAYLYLAVTGVCGLLAIGIVVALIRQRMASSPEKIANRAT
jgi:hypothetical protein